MNSFPVASIINRHNNSKTGYILNLRKTSAKFAADIPAAIFAAIFADIVIKGESQLQRIDEKKGRKKIK